MEQPRLHLRWIVLIPCASYPPWIAGFPTLCESCCFSEFIQDYSHAKAADLLA